jgi:hypothetical protein
MRSVNPIALGACIAFAGIASTLFPAVSLVFFGIILAATAVETKTAPNDALMACAVGMFLVSAIRFAIWAM